MGFIAIIILVGLALVTLVFLALKDWLKDIIKKTFHHKLDHFFEKIGWFEPEKKDLPPQVNIQIINIDKLIRNEYNIPVRANLEQDVIEFDNKEPSTKNHEIKLNTLFAGFNTTYPIIAANHIHSEIYNLLENENIKTGFQLYNAHELARKSDNKAGMQYIERGLSAHKEINEWFKNFEILNINGNFTNILLPISKEVKTINDETKKEFTKFIIEILKKECSKPLKLGELKVNILKISRPGISTRTYTEQIEKTRKKGANLIILCSRGWWNGYCEQLGKVFEELYKYKVETFEATFYPDKLSFDENKNGKKSLGIFLK